MIKNRFVIIPASILAVILIANGLQFGGRLNSVTYSYQAVACPRGENGTSLDYSLPSKSTLIRGIGNKKANLFKAGRTRVTAGSSASYIEANGVSILGWLAKSGSWAGAVLCTAPRDSQWFTGGTADISGRGRIVLVNSGLSSATVELLALSDNAGEVKKTVNVKSNSISEVSLVSLTPGAIATAVRVALINGRVSAFMLDERGKGLRTLGGDVVNAQVELSKDLIIPAIPVDSNTKATALLRVANPNSSDATISVRLISKDGNFVPVGLEEVKVSAGRAANFDIPITQPSNQFGLRITSNKSIAAAVYNVATVNGHRDFTWSTPATPLQKGQWAIRGLNGKIVFAGEKINVYIEITGGKGKRIKHHITGSDIATWKLPKDGRILEIRGVGENVFAGLILDGKSGVGISPLIPGSTMTRSSLPTANIGVLNP